MTFIENVSAAVDKLGPENPGIVIGLGKVDWPNDQARDLFLDTMTRGDQ